MRTAARRGEVPFPCAVPKERWDAPGGTGGVWSKRSILLGSAKVIRSSRGRRSRGRRGVYRETAGTPRFYACVSLRLRRRFIPTISSSGGGDVWCVCACLCVCGWISRPPDRGIRRLEAAPWPPTQRRRVCDATSDLGREEESLRGSTEERMDIGRLALVVTRRVGRGRGAGGPKHVVAAGGGSRVMVVSRRARWVLSPSKEVGFGGLFRTRASRFGLTALPLCCPSRAPPSR